jgi:hypothetical protein
MMMMAWLRQKIDSLRVQSAVVSGAVLSLYLPLGRTRSAVKVVLRYFMMMSSG